MKKTLFLFLMLSFVKTYAGWYICYNYEGTIDTYPIHLSVQIEYDWAGNKKERNVDGVYFYNKYHQPIKLKGTLKNGNEIELKEYNEKGKPTAIFKFDLSKTDCTGNWTNAETLKISELHIIKKSCFTDANKEGKIDFPSPNFIPNNQFDIPIIQSNSLRKFYFIGIYSLDEPEKAQMSRLEIRNKEDNRLFQTINLSSLEQQSGNVITVIFDNVEIVNLKTNEFLIWYNIGRMGGYLTVKYNSKKQKFILNPKPIIDGPN